MKLINYLILRITLVFTAVMLLWSGIYFFLQMKEIHNENDDGLTDLKQEFILKANSIPNFVETMEHYAPLNLIVNEISQAEVETITEHFTTTKVYFESEQEEENVRMLTSAFHCTQNDKYYRIQFFTSTFESDAIVKNLLYLLLGLWIALVLTITLISKIIISRVNKPFFRALNELYKFQLDNSKMPDFSETRIKEYVQLNDAIKELLDKNIRVFTKQKQFIENVSHELQTPLAIITAHLEKMLEKHQDNEEHANEIATLLKTHNRMKRLNNNLLLLSKIQNNQFPALSVVNLRNVLDEVFAEFKEIVTYKQLTVEIVGDASPSLQMSADLAHILFSNLVKNAVAYTVRGGKIIASYQENAIVISNSGNTPVADVFGRYKSDTSSGLGLSIVKSITDLYKIDIEYQFKDNLHIFDLKLN